MNQCSARHIQQLFTPEECLRIQDIIDTSKLKPAEVHRKEGDNSDVYKKTRKSDILWLKRTTETDWIFDRIGTALKRVNEEQFGFSINHVEDIQYTRYKKFQFFKYHFDTGTEPSATRKLTISIQLSKPSSYVGGALEVMTVDGKISASKEQGDALVFPSFLLHRAGTIWSGERHCLVTWARSNTLFT